MSKNDTVDRTRGPELELSTSIGKDDSALVIGLISASSPDDAEKAGPTAEPTLAIGDGILDDAQAAAITAALTALGATGSHGEVTRTAAPESLPVDIVVAVGAGRRARCARGDPEDRQSRR